MDGNPLLQNPFKVKERGDDGTVTHTINEDDRFGQVIKIPNAPYHKALHETRVMNRGSNGMSTDGTRRHIADVPADIWAVWRQKYGPLFHKDKKLLKRLIREGGFSVVTEGSF